jgi:hypothetical protein
LACSKLLPRTSDGWSGNWFYLADGALAVLYHYKDEWHVATARM